MEDAPENGKESLHSAHANGMHEWMNEQETVFNFSLFPYMMKYILMLLCYPCVCVLFSLLISVFCRNKPLFILYGEEDDVLKNSKSLPHNIQAKKIKPSAFGHHHTLVWCCNLMTRCGMVVVMQRTVLLLITMIAVISWLTQVWAAQIDRCTYVHTYIHTHKYIHIHAYTHIHTYIDTYIHTYVHPPTVK